MDGGGGGGTSGARRFGGELRNPLSPFNPRQRFEELDPARQRELQQAWVGNRGAAENATYGWDNPEFAQFMERQMAGGGVSPYEQARKKQMEADLARKREVAERGRSHQGRANAAKMARQRSFRAPAIRGF